MNRQGKDWTDPPKFEDEDNRETATTKVQYQQDMKTQVLPQQWSKRRGIVQTDIWIVIVNHLVDVCW
jgi:hypothetical protein